MSEPSRVQPSLAPKSPSSSRPRDRTVVQGGSSGREIPSTPVRRAPATGAGSSAFTSTTATATAPSPHYATTLRSRHSLYGTEDRVVLDLGSSVWKAGFSGEPSPRVCTRALSSSFSEDGSRELGLWCLDKCERDSVQWEIREERLKRELRSIWFEHLMTDPKARKTLIVENPLLPLRVKELIARVLFENLQVPSLSFVASPVLSMMASGTLTGLVLDCGNLETTVVPVFGSRPLYSNMLSSPRAGARLSSRLRALLLHHGSYARPPSSLNSTTLSPIGPIPREILTEELVEEIKTRMCYVCPTKPNRTNNPDDPSSTSPQDVQVTTYDEAEDTDLMKQLEKLYKPGTAATTVSFRVPSLSQPVNPTGVGRGWIQIPGWVRERAAEVLFEDGDEDERSVTELILECLLKLPIDLRKPLSSSILITGGTAMLPGFFTRLHDEIQDKLKLSHPPSLPQSPPSSPSRSTIQRKAQLRRSLSALRTSPHFSSLVPLAQHIAITNDPTRHETSTARRPAAAGRAPAFNPALLPWIGGSLAGALKTGGHEIQRDAWEDAIERAANAIPSARDVFAPESQAVEQEVVLGPASLLQDWSKPTLMNTA